MADGDTQTPPTPDLSGLDQGTLSRLITQLIGPQTAPQPMQPAASTRDGRGLLSLFGEALGGGQQYGTTEEREAGGLSAAQAAGARMMAASDWSYQPHTLGSIIAQGYGGARQSLGETQSISAARQAAAQDYARQQQQDQLARIKEAIPLLSLQQRMDAAKAATKIALGNNTPGATPGTSIASVGSVDVPAEYLPFYQEASARTGVPVEILIAQHRQESGFNPGATGAAGEIGIGQISPKTATDPGYGMTGLKNPDVLRDPRTNINFAADYLAAKAKAAGADFSTPEGVAKALKAYNGGGDPDYVNHVLRYVPGAQTALAPKSAPGQTAAATPPPPPGAQPPTATPGQPVPPTPPGTNPNAPVPIPPPTVPPNAPPVQTAGPGAGNAPPGAPGAPDATPPATAPVPPPPLDLSTFRATPGPLPDSPIYNPNLTPAEIAARTKQSQIEAAGLPTPEALAKIQGDIAAAQTAKRAAAEKAIEEYRAAETTRQFEAAKLAAAERDKIAAEQRAAAQKEIEAQANHKRTLEAQQAQTENQYVLDERKAFGTEREAARQSIDDTQVLRALSSAAGTTGPIEQLHLPNGASVRDFLVQKGWGSPEAIQRWSTQQAFEQAANQMIIGMRKGVQMGQLSDRDMAFIQSLVPRLSQNPATRDSILATIENAQSRKREYIDTVEQLWDGGKGLSWGQARREADKRMSPIVPQVPREYSGMSQSDRLAWFQKYAAPGTIFRGPDKVDAKGNVIQRGDIMVAPDPNAPGGTR